jgi:hypothetical protein
LRRVPEEQNPQQRPQGRVDGANARRPVHMGASGRGSRATNSHMCPLRLGPREQPCVDDDELHSWRRTGPRPRLCGEAAPVETSAHGTRAPSAVYEIGGRRYEIGSRGFAEAIADAHAAHQRPWCMCLVEGVEMYVARLAQGYIVKRMPDTGSHHAPECPSYEPPAEYSGLGQMLGSAITEDPATGETTLRLAFPLAKMAGRSTMPPAGSDGDSVSSTGTKLSLRACCTTCGTRPS